MKIISMYLPQFHRVKENDEWWGEGYTEWTAVKRAESLFDGHLQPNIPLGGNYYDLMKKTTMEKQADLMYQYGVDGQCFYHYWFKNGRQILERPAENLLQWMDIDMKFCFCWANQTWARTWSKIQEKNEWAFRFEKPEEHSGSGILLEQQYGDEGEWKIHYDYLKKFFVDGRYIKHNGKPLFLVYRSRLITCLGDMLACWNKWAIEDGFKGIYVIGANADVGAEKYLDGILSHEPQNTISQIPGHKEHGVVKYSYKRLWETLLSACDFGKKTYYGGFVGYDDTPRRGEGGIVVEGASPELFREYLPRLIAKNVSAGNEYVFLNAWNEWGEGMYLEPDTRNGYSYLEAVRDARKRYTEYLEEYRQDRGELEISLINELDRYRKKSFRYEKYWKIFDAWMSLREQGKKIECYLTRQGIRKIAIYGAGMLGRHLITELSGGNVEIVCAIDQKAELLKFPFPVYKPEETFPAVDAVIFTVVADFEEIRDRIREKINGSKIILLEKMIMDLSDAESGTHNNV